MIITSNRNIFALDSNEILLLMIVVYQVAILKSWEVDGHDGLTGPADKEGNNGEKGDKGEPGIPGEQGIQGLPGPISGGALYTRWGKTTCPGTPGTELVYSGLAGGSLYSHSGGGANYLCLPEDHSTFANGIHLS